MIAPFPPIAAPAMARPLRLSPAPPSPVVDAGSQAVQSSLKATGRPGLKPPPIWCDTELVIAARPRVPYGPCWRTPALPFAARCGCGHPIRGYACAGCLESAGRACLTCWRPGAGAGRRRHICPVVVLGEVPGPSP